MKHLIIPRMNSISIDEIIKKHSKNTQEEHSEEYNKKPVIPSNLDNDRYLQIPNTNHVIDIEQTNNNLDYNDLHLVLSQSNLSTPDLYTFMNHFVNVVNAYHKKSKLLTASGKELSRTETEKLYEKLTKNCWSWLNGTFVEGSGFNNMDLQTHKVIDDQVVEKARIPLEQHINEACFVNLKLNNQGLPIQKSRSQSYNQGENIKFWRPKLNGVARFIASSGRADFICDGYPTGSNPALGVFACSEISQSSSDPNYIFLPNSNIEIAKQPTLHGLDRDKQHEELKKRNERMPRIYEFVGLLKYLIDNPTLENTKIFSEITEVRNPWRAENLDAYFEDRNGEMYILTLNKSKAEKLDKDTLIQDKTPGIDLVSWINNPTSQGLPRSNVKYGSLYYWNPKNNYVARFIADSGRAYFCCDGGPAFSDPALGVRAVREKVSK